MTTRALDGSVLERLRQLNREGQPDVVREVLGVFLTDAPRRLAAIDDALRNTDARSLQREAHALTGAAASIGATVLHDRCRALEEMGRSASLDGAPDVVRQIHSEFDRVRDEISGLL